MLDAKTITDGIVGLDWDNKLRCLPWRRSCSSSVVAGRGVVVETTAAVHDGSLTSMVDGLASERLDLNERG